MQGKNDSILTRMKGVAPGLFVLKCYCHTFHLIAQHASKALSKTAEQLIHDVYNYFKSSPNRQNSYAEFQSFLELDIHKILKPCQTRWLSVAKCVERILEQWPALELLFVAEADENKSPQADRILLEFCNFVLGDLDRPQFDVSIKWISASSASPRGRACRSHILQEFPKVSQWRVS